ncbi:beta-propeller fold lactonase family protein [Kitasatospora sp. NPDC056327]|uniref:beta-propeller fold lactonase family protein n=1 Tax=Kitasatospora sp. NPDC056327 TaxID=3345785 RepID=UPI0035E0AF37
MNFPYMLVANRGADSVSFIDLREPGELKRVGDDIPVGIGPRAVVLSPAHVGYVVNEGRDGTVPGTVSVIDARDPQAVKRGPDVTVGLLPRAVALSAGADYAYVVNRGADSVSLLDIASDPLQPTKVGADLPVGAQPSAIAVDAVTGRAFVPNWGARTVTILPRTGDGTGATVTIDVGDRPRAVAVHPSAGAAYIANWGSGTVSVVRAAQQAGPSVATVTVGSRPRALAVNPGGDLLYVANYGAGTVTAVRLSPDTGLPAGGARTITVGRRPAAVAFAPDGSFAYTVNHTAGSLSVIDTATRTARQFLLGTAPIAVSFKADGSYAWVTDHAAGALIAVYCGGPRVVNRKPVDKAPVSLAVAPGGERLLVTDDEKDKVTPVTLSDDLTVGTPLDLGGGAAPRAVTYAPDGTRAYITAAGTDDVRVLDPGATKQQEAIPLGVGAAPRGIAATPDGRYVCTADSGRDTLSVIGAGAEKIGQLTDREFRMPVGLAAAPLDGRSVLYVTNFVSSEEADGTVSVLELDAAGSSVQRSWLISKEDGHFDRPHGIAVTADRSTLYVANYNSGEVSVLDGTTGRWQRSFTQELDFPYGTWLAEDRKLLYVANSGNKSVTVFNTDTGAPHVIQDSSHGLAQPRGVVVHDGVLYVANAANQAISVLVLKPNGYEVASVEDAIRPVDAKGLTGLSMSKDGRVLFATDQEAQAVFVLTLKDNRLQKQETITQQTGGFDAPHEALRSSDGRLLYVVNAGLASHSPSVSVLRDRVYPVRLRADTGPWDVACTSDSAYAVVTGHGNDTVTVVDPAARKAEAPLTLPPGSAPTGVACSPQGVHAYVVGQGTDDVTVLRRDPSPAESGDRTDPLPGPVRGLAVDPRGGRVYLTGDSQVYAAPPMAGGAPTATLECEGSRLGGAAAHPAEPRIYVADRSLPGIRVIGIDDPDHPSETPIPVPGTVPAGLAVHPSGELLYLCDQTPDSGGVRVLDLAAEDAPRLLRGAGAVGLPAATAVAVHPSARYAYVACQDPARIGVVALGRAGRGLTRLPGHDLAVPGPIGALAVHRSGGYAYATVAAPSGGVLVLDLVDPARPRLAGQRECASAAAVAFAPDGDTAHLAYGTRLTTLTLGPPVLDGTPIGLDPGAEPREVAVSPDGTQVYVTGHGNDTLYVIDAATRTVRYRMTNTKGPVDVVADPAGVKIYLTDSGRAPTSVAADAPTSVVVVDTTSHVKEKTADTGIDPRAAYGPDVERN